MKHFRRLHILILSGLVIFGACSSGNQDQKANKTPDSTGQSITNDATVNISNRDLVRASLEGNQQLIEKAAEQGIDLDKKDQSGRTPLMLASYNGHTDLVQFLLEHKANPNTTDNQGRTPLTFAASGPYPDTVRLLLENGANANVTDNKEGWSALMWAAAEGNTEVVKVLLNHGADPNLKDKDNETARDFAESNGHSSIADLLTKAENEK